MYTPTSTYRLQLNGKFRLQDVAEIVTYLRRLGISTIYASPFFESVTGSTHGYDVTNPGRINPEIGALDEFRALSKTLHEQGMGWLQDIVPNHLAWSPLTPWLLDIMKRGKASPYCRFFDVDWQHPDCPGKIMAPFLGAEVEEVVKQKQISIVFAPEGFSFQYFNQKFPLSINSGLSLSRQLKKQFAVHAAGNVEADEEANYAQDLQNAKPEIDELLQHINQDDAALLQLLEQQHYKLMHWQAAERTLNYRRFFTINGLIGLRMEDEQVFEEYHRFIQSLCSEGLVQGLRVDHIDGLYDPANYLKQLRALVGKDTYIVVEKILEPEERMPAWEIQGSTGYDFTSIVNRLYCCNDNSEKLDAVYRQFAGETHEYEEITFEREVSCMIQQMSGDLDNLLRLMKELQLLPGNIEYTTHRNVLASFMAALPVYRLYLDSDKLDQYQLDLLQKAFTLAEARRPALKNELTYLASLFLKESISADALLFLKRVQQFTGALTAKGVEDTTFYVYNKLLSRNEVGDSPAIAGVATEAFHDIMQERAQYAKHSLNATATHDTKRGEDTRMRINVLTELADEWETCVQVLYEEMKPHKLNVNDILVPDLNTEYFIYQSLLGAWPFETGDAQEFQKRFNEFIIKAVREAKSYTTWSAPDQQYEDAVLAFTNSFFQSKKLLDSTFLPLVKKAAHYGMLYSLGQVVLKITTPGIPDIYQGTELWDLSFVDPDNRRQVDYAKRKEYLDWMDEQATASTTSLVEQLTTEDNLKTGKIKLYTLTRALQLRNSLPALFANGEYLPLETQGEQSDHILAFARVFKKDWVIVLVPLKLTSLVGAGEFPFGKEVWKDSTVQLPSQAPSKWKNIFTGEAVTSESRQIALSEVFGFPVVILRGEKVPD